MKFHSKYSTEKLTGETKFTEPSRTKQAFKDECDINNILAKYNKTGLLPDMIKANPQYGDFSDVPDYQTSLNIVAKVQEQFENLPAKVRDRFKNDPSQFLEFVNNKENLPEMEKMGLLKEKPKPQDPIKVDVTNPTPTKPVDKQT